jgi:hypothetical protein
MIGCSPMSDIEDIVEGKYGTSVKNHAQQDK